MKEVREYVEPVSLAALPKKSNSSIIIGKIAGTNYDAFLDINLLTKHLFIVGGPGSGKTTVAMIIVDGCLNKGISVFVFDPSDKWIEFGKKYKEFEEVKVSYKNLKISPSCYAKKGLVVFSLSELTPNDYNDFIKNAIEELSLSLRETLNELKILLVFENAYKLTPSFGGNAALLVEKACREFRKFGVGIILITHSYSDFGPAVLGNVATEIWLRTTYENDLDVIRRKYGGEFAKSLVKTRKGEGMIANVDFNYSKPWFVEFLKSSHTV
ncbi:MAG: type IV secretory system conjugative DNA transfer family protein [Candidatus Aenigmatarchaeota archaeon]